MILVNAIGHLGADAEVKTINERQYISFRIASTEKRNGQDETTWLSVLSSVNENVLPYLKKGQQVFVSGRMSAKIFQSQQSFGIDINIYANSMQLCGGRRDDSQAPTQPAAQPQPVQPVQPFPPQQAAFSQPDDDSVLPF